MKDWLRIRKKVLVEGISKRQVLRDERIHWETLKKILEHPEPPGYRISIPRPKSKIGPFLGRIQQILDGDRHTHWKQRHTAKRIFQRLRDEEGYTGSYTTVKKEVRALKKKKQEVFIPLIHRPGEAQVDFGYALACIAGVLRKIAFFVMCLPYSDAMFVMACQSECTESFWEGHVRAFEFFGFVPNRITYDNSKVMIRNITGCHQRELTQGFLSLQSHYLFDEHFCTVRRANEKGVVEGCVKYSRLNFMVPVPQVQDLQELNEHLLKSCIGDLQRRLRGKNGTKEELLAEDHAAGLGLPATPFDSCIKTSAEANSLSLVRFKTNDYSVPSEYAYHLIDIKGYIDRVCVDRADASFHESSLVLTGNPESKKILRLKNLANVLITLPFARRLLGRVMLVLPFDALYRLNVIPE